jgi:hypothetical protein
MIFMGVGQKEAGDVVALFLEKPDIRQDDVDARLELAAESHAHIDDQPGVSAATAIAVEIEIHADLADAAKGHEDECVTAAI